jgi:transcriptional regulator with XRE-family HTH domain
MTWAHIPSGVCPPWRSGPSWALKVWLIATRWPAAATVRMDVRRRRTFPKPMGIEAVCQIVDIIPSFSGMTDLRADRMVVLVPPPEFARLFKEYRDRSGLSQEALAKLTGVSPKTIGNWERGAVRRPRERTLKLFKDAFGLTDEEYAGFVAAAHQSRFQKGPSTFEQALHEAADTLAFEVKRELKLEERQGFRDPHSLPVAWRTVGSALVDHWENILGTEEGETVRPLDLDGSLSQLAATYGRIPSERLVVLGRAGSGKSVLAARLAQDLLANREPGGAVPVIFRLGSWHPRTDLHAWLAKQLENDHPDLLRPLSDRSTTAVALLATGRILPVLDGFDEMAEGLHHKALRKLNLLSGPLVLLSRSAEFAGAVKRTGRPLTGGAVVELEDLTHAQLAGYLLRTAHPSERWQGILDAVKDEPEGRLAKVFATPLMVSLAREVYGDGYGPDPAGLLDTDRFPTAESVEEHLLDALVRAVYRDQAESDRYESEHARHWLEYLAYHLRSLGERDLAWWRIGASLPQGERMLVMTLTLGFVFAILDSIAILALGLGPVLLESGLSIDFALGMSFAIVHGLLHRFRGAVFEPSRFRMRLRGNATWTWDRLARRFGLGFITGLLLPLGFTIVRDLNLGLTGGIDALQLLVAIVIDSAGFGLPAGLCGGAVFVAIALLERPLDFKSVHSPADLMRASRRTLLAQVLVFGPALAIAFPFALWVEVSLLQQLPPQLGDWRWGSVEAVILGLYAGTFGPIGYVLALTGWGQWLVFGRLWLPLTGRLPWGLPAFLADACERGVMRSSGAVHQFRHARLQDDLAAAYEERTRRSRR